MAQITAADVPDKTTAEKSCCHVCRILLGFSSIAPCWCSKQALFFKQRQNKNKNNIGGTR